MIKFKVLKKDIVRANKLLDVSITNIHSSCPVALALKRKTRKKVSVGTCSVSIGDKEYIFDDDTTDFILNFDADRFNELKTPFYGTATLKKESEKWLYSM